MTAIKKNLGNFAAIIALILIAGGVSFYILQQQRLQSGAFTPQQAALNQANQFEGVAQALAREGKPAASKRWTQRALAIRKSHDLMGKQWDIRRGRLTIVDVPGKLTAAGAPRVAPYMARGGNATLSRAYRADASLKNVKGTVNAQ